ncbi:MAG: DoxX family protein [Verrucomicrobiota bacterium]
MCVVGVVKVGLALALIAAIWRFTLAAQPAAIGMGLLMLGAFVMHLKVKDPMKKALCPPSRCQMCRHCACAGGEIRMPQDSGRAFNAR